MHFVTAGEVPNIFVVLHFKVFALEILLCFSFADCFLSRVQIIDFIGLFALQNFLEFLWQNVKVT